MDDLSFTVRPGVVTGFLGPNSSGKSTTMRMVMGLDAPTSGKALINELLYAQLRWPLREIGALLEAKAIHPSRSAFNDLWMLAQTNDIPRSRVNEVLDVVGLHDVAHLRAGSSPSAWADASASPPSFSATLPSCCSTNPSTAL